MPSRGAVSGPFRPCRDARGRARAAPRARSRAAVRSAPPACRSRDRSRWRPGPAPPSTPGCSASTHITRLASSNPISARSVTTRHIPPEMRPRSARVSPPSRKPGLVTKSTFGTKRRFSCFIATIIWVSEEMSLPPPVPGSRIDGAAGLADERAVQVAVAVDLRPAHEADVDVAALQEQQHVGDRQDHVRPPRAALLVGRRRQLARHDERPDHAALEEDRQGRRVEALRERRREQRDADAREHRLAVLEQARGHHGEQLGCGVARVLSH